jgi:outer membrane protein OmpA-like peptidoglycan-associated protein
LPSSGSDHVAAAFADEKRPNHIRGIPMNSKILIAGLAALSLSACTSINPYTGQSQVSNTTGGALVGAGGGAVVGALIGGATGGDPRVGALIGAGLGGMTGAMVGKYMDQQEAELRAQLQGTGVSVTRVGQQIILNMPSNITFATDSSTIQPQFNETLVDVYGYTDNTGSDTYNYDLSQKRAVAVATVLASQGVIQGRFHITGKGEEEPIASNATEAGRSQNRRVEIQLSPIEG